MSLEIFELRSRGTDDDYPSQHGSGGDSRHHSNRGAADEHQRARCESGYGSANPPLRLNLSGLRSADRDGIRALQSLAEAGAELHGANPYINQLLLEAST